MSFFGRFLTKVKFFLIGCAKRTRFSETRSLSDQNCMLKNFLFLKVTEKIYVNSRSVSAPRPKISNLLRFENGFEIRNLHHFVLKNFLFLKVTEKIYVNSRLVSAPRPKISNLLRFENGFEIRDLYHFANKNVPHTISQILRVTDIQ